ncbi:MAG: hypothetical protein WCQ99_11260 [Pseudomonadota bacterium]
MNRIFLCILCVTLLSYCSALAEDNATEPHLVFKKSVIVKPYEDGQVYTEPHIVKEGEHLWKILREHYKLANSKIAFYCTAAKAINPEVRDVNDLRPSQNILVPYEYVKGSRPEIPEEKKPTLPGSEYTVKEGEHLGKILRDVYRIPEAAIFQERTGRLIKDANPHLKDTNALEKGWKIMIPPEILNLSGQAQAKQKAAEVLHKESTPPDSLHAKEPVPQRKADLQETELPVEAVEDYDTALTRDESRAKNMLASLAGAFGGTDNRTGKEMLPVAGGGAVTLEYNKFPVYEFPWGRKVLFDYGSRLSPAMKEVVAAEWKNAEIVAVRERDDMETILGKVLDGCGFATVEKGGEYIVNRDNIQVSVSGNWIVFKDTMLKNVFVINLLEGGETGMPESFKAYLSGMGLNIVDIKKGTAAQDKYNPEYTSRAEYHKAQADPAILTDLILEILGQKYQKDYTTKIFQNMYSGFSLEVLADRMFKKDDETFLVDFHNLPKRITGIIAEQGFHLLQIDVQEDLPAIVKKVLDFCNASYKPSPVKFQYDRGEKSNIKLTVPGVLVQTGDGDVLLTHIALSEPIVQFLSEIDIKVIKY